MNQLCRPARFGFLVSVTVKQYILSLKALRVWCFAMAALVSQCRGEGSLWNFLPLYNVSFPFLKTASHLECVSNLFWAVDVVCGARDCGKLVTPQVLVLLGSQPVPRRTAPSDWVYHSSWTLITGTQLLQPHVPTCLQAVPLLFTSVTSATWWLQNKLLTWS